MAIINTPKLLKEFEAAGMTNVWADSTGRLTHENATPEQLALAQRLLEAHDPEPDSDEKRKAERAAASEFAPETVVALVLELTAWAKSQGYTSPLVERVLAKEDEIIKKHPAKSEAETRLKE